MSAYPLRVLTSIPGISTLPSLYLNETVSRIRDSGASDSALQALESLQGHRELLDGCEFPADASASDRLLRMAVSSSYWRGLDKRPEVARGVMESLGRSSKIAMPSGWLRRPDSSDSRVPRLLPAVDLPRALGQAEALLSQFAESSRLQPPEDLIVDVLDTVLPCFHLLFGSLMIYQEIGFQAVRDPKISSEIADWSRLHHVFIGMLENVYPWMEPKLGVPTDRVLVEAALRGEKMQMIDFEGFRGIATAFAGIDVLLGVFVRGLSQEAGRWAQEMSAYMMDLRRERSWTLLKKFASLPAESVIAGSKRWMS